MLQECHSIKSLCVASSQLCEKNRTAPRFFSCIVGAVDDVDFLLEFSRAYARGCMS
jgi:hypothetical protein